MVRHKTKLDRRHRRAAVADMIASGADSASVTAAISREFKVAPRTLQQDIEWVFEQWADQDREAMTQHLGKFLRRVDRGSMGAEKAGNWSAMAQFEALRLRFLERAKELHFREDPEDAARVTDFTGWTWARMLKAMQAEEEAMTKNALVKVIE